MDREVVGTLWKGLYIAVLNCSVFNTGVAKPSPCIVFWVGLVSLACVSGETHNLKRVFRPGEGGVVPYIGYIGMCRAKGYVYLAILVWNRVSVSTILVWNRVLFGLGMFFRRISYFFIIWRSDHFPFNVYANHRVRAATACHSLRSRAGHQGFRFETGYQIFDQVWNRVGKITDFGLKYRLLISRSNLQAGETWMPL